MASSGSDGELIRGIKRPEPAPASGLPLGLLTWLLGVRGSFDERGHGLLCFQCEVVTPIDAAHTRWFAVCAEKFQISFRGCLPAAAGVANLLDEHLEPPVLQTPLGAPGFVERLEPAVPFPVMVRAAAHEHHVVVICAGRVELGTASADRAERRLMSGRLLRPEPDR